MAKMNGNGGTASDATTAATFRNKAAFMKTWRPENAPSVRDISLCDGMLDTVIFFHETKQHLDSCTTFISHSMFILL